MIRNFLFHRVNPKRDQLWDPMDVQLFDKCIAHISSKYQVVLFEDLVDSELHQSKNKVATIMFDDGYKDNFQFALPILEKYNCKASFYVVTNCIDQNIPTWTHILEHLFQFTAIQDIQLTYSFLPENLHVNQLKTAQDRIDYVTKLKPFLKTISHENRETILNHVINTFRDVALPQLMMDWNDLRKLKAKGHYIGSHTCTHPALGTITDKQTLDWELSHSRNRIFEELGHYPRTISYPVGSFNEETKRAAKEAGYEIGLAVKQQLYIPTKSDVYEVDRIELYNESWFKTKMRISNRLEEIKRLIRYR